jgi:SAM-dependent methyltransferase
MASVREHYDQLLGPVYSWIVGDLDNARRQNAALFAKLGLQAVAGDKAFDLGCGPGSQSLPLAEMGYVVTAVDFCQELLDELGHSTQELPVTPLFADIMRFAEFVDDPLALIVCMGDTLVHLPDRSAVESLVESAALCLRDEGSLVLSLRDYSAPGPEGAARFIPIRSTDDRIFTCFLDYEECVVNVHDIMHTLRDGKWTMQVSGYRKLRVDVAWLSTVLARNGLALVEVLPWAGMIVLHARKHA